MNIPNSYDGHYIDPIYPNMTYEQVDIILENLTNFYNHTSTN